MLLLKLLRAVFQPAPKKSEPLWYPCKMCGATTYRNDQICLDCHAQLCPCCQLRKKENGKRFCEQCLQFRFSDMIRHCGNKRQYASEDEAEDACLEVESKPKNRKKYDDRLLVPYKCEYCKAWHIGHI